MSQPSIIHCHTGRRSQAQIQIRSPFGDASWYVLLSSLFIFVLRVSSRAQLILKWKKCLVLHCGTPENVLWNPLLWRPLQWNKWKSGDKSYTHFTVYEKQTQLSIIYLKDVKKKKMKTLHINCSYLNLVVLRNDHMAISEEGYVCGNEKWECMQGGAARP